MTINFTRMKRFAQKRLEIGTVAFIDSSKTTILGRVG